LFSRKNSSDLLYYAPTRPTGLGTVSKRMHLLQKEDTNARGHSSWHNLALGVYSTVHVSGEEAGGGRMLGGSVNIYVLVGFGTGA
jgi:hypothetical protein